MSREAQFERLRAYLQARYKSNGGMTREQVAKELLLKKEYIDVLVSKGELKSCHVEDVVEYIIKKDSKNGKD